MNRYWRILSIATRNQLVPIQWSKTIGMAKNGYLVINYYWRILATGFCFSLFGLGGVFLSLSLFLLIYISPLKPNQKKDLVQYLVHLNFKGFVLTMQLVGVLSIRLKGLESIKTVKGQLIIANHPTLIDVVLLMSIIPRITCVVKNDVWMNLFMMSGVRSAGYIPNAEPKQLLNGCISVLKAGENLIIFPEGSRSIQGQPLKFHRGTARIAIQSQKNITPIIISSNSTSLAKGYKWYQVPKKGKFIISMEASDEIDIKPFLSTEKSMRIQSRELSSYLENYYKRVIKTNE